MEVFFYSVQPLIKSNKCHPDSSRLLHMIHVWYIIFTYIYHEKFTNMCLTQPEDDKMKV